MDVVVDVNVIISVLIKPGKPIELFFNDSLRRYSCDYVFEKLNAKKEIISKKNKNF